MMKRFATSRSITAILVLHTVLGFSMVGLSVGLATGRPAQAQERGPVQRIVHGRVATKDGAGVKGAVVYLQDTKTSSVKTAIADDDGTYRFVQLTQATDYQLWAKSDGKQSKTKSISSFDSKNDMLMNLILE